MRPVVLTILASASVVIPAGASAASTGCADLNGGFETQIRATNITCNTARDIVGRWHDKAVDQQQGPYGVRYVGTYFCRSHSAGDPEHVIVNCANRTKKVRFFAGP